MKLAVLQDITENLKKNFSSIAKPLTDQFSGIVNDKKRYRGQHTRSQVPWKWDQEQQHAFEALNWH